MLTDTLLSFLLSALPLPTPHATLIAPNGQPQLQLQWKQQSEPAGANYRIEQALPGGGPWLTVATADAVGRPGQTTNYSYALAPVPAGTRFRLAQRQADGQLVYSVAITLPPAQPLAGSPASLGAYPQPASAGGQELLMLLGVDAAAGPLHVLSLQGRRLAELPPIAGPHALHLPPGVYLLQQGTRTAPLIFK